VANLVQRIAGRLLGVHPDLLSGASVSALVEAIAELQDDQRGWRLVGDGAGVQEIDPTRLRELQRQVQEVWARNPLAGQVLELKRNFVLGAGVSFAAEDPAVQEALRAFWDDDRNRMILAQREWFDSLQLFGELCIRFFPEITGEAQVRLIPPLEIAHVVTKSEDRAVLTHVVREWTERQFDTVSMTWRSNVEHSGTQGELIKGNEVFWLSINHPPGWVRGIPPLYRALPWLKAYEEWLKDRARWNKARSAYAWHKQIKGPLGQQLANLAKATAQKVGGALRGLAGTPADLKPPKSGSVIVSSENVDWKLINAQVGAGDAGEDGRALKMMICAATNVMEHYFGDASVANLASAQAMELPMRREYEYLQGLMAWVLHAVFRRVIAAQVKAGRLPEQIAVVKRRWRDGITVEDKVEKAAVDCYIDINFPALKQEERAQLVQAANSELQMGVKSRATVASELGVEDWDQEQALIAKEREERLAWAREEMSVTYPPFRDDGGGRGGGGGQGEKDKQDDDKGGGKGEN